MQSLNAFAVVLLAFPFYLAQKGRLSDYVDLAKTGAATPPVSAASSPSSATKSTGTASNTTSDSISATAGLVTLSSLPSLFQDAAPLFS